MGKKVDERRKGFRVPMADNICWQSGTHNGESRLLDISPGGAALEIPAQDPLEIGTKIKLEVKLADEIKWCVADRALVVRKVDQTPDQCRVSVEFPLSGDRYLPICGDSI